MMREEFLQMEHKLFVLASGTLPQLQQVVNKNHEALISKILNINLELPTFATKDQLATDFAKF